MLFITEDEVHRLIKWPELVNAIGTALIQINREGEYVMPQRSFMNLPEINGMLLYMPAYGATQNLITCKLLTVFPKNWERYQQPSHNGCICAFSTENGQMLAVVDASVVTTYRTAAGSIAAMKYLHSPGVTTYKEKTLAVLGTGEQGRAHIIGCQQIFNFGQVKIWNRNQQRAINLSNELNEQHGIATTAFEDVRECVNDADAIICTFSYTPENILRHSYIRSGCFIVVVGFPETGDVAGVEESIYLSAHLYTEKISNVEKEMHVLTKKKGIEFREIGEVISGAEVPKDDTKNFILYQTLGIALMDTAAVKLVLDKRAETPYS